MELTNFFKPKSDRSVSKSMPELKELIIHLSSSNVNIHPLSLMEASREKRDEQKVFSEKKWIDHIHAFLLAQCVDIESSQLNSPELIQLQESNVDLKNYDALASELAKQDVIRLTNEPFYKEIDERLSAHAAEREFKF